MDKQQIYFFQSYRRLGDLAFRYKINPNTYFTHFNNRLVSYFHITTIHAILPRVFFF
jgi:hypothetical protein